MTSLTIVARKELLDIRRNRFLGALLLFMLIVVIASVVVAAAQFRVTADQYRVYVDALRQSGSTAIPTVQQLFPLRLLRGGVEYLELIGALFAIVIGYGMIAKERHQATMELLFSRPISRYAAGGGKILALAVLWLAAVACIFGIVAGALVMVGGAPLSVLDLLRLLIAAIATWIYLLLWSCIAMGLASSTRHLSTGLVAALVLWLVVVLVIPQIGDTMDPDNQVPGGLFKSLQIAKADETAVLAHFASFDAVRNGIEVSSVTKHFERLTFAFLGIKDQFNGMAPGAVALETLVNSVAVFILALAAIGFAGATTTRRTLLRRQS